MKEIHNEQLQEENITLTNRLTQQEQQMILAEDDRKQRTEKIQQLRLAFDSLQNEVEQVQPQPAVASPFVFGNPTTSSANATSNIDVAASIKRPRDSFLEAASSSSSSRRYRPTTEAVDDVPDHEEDDGCDDSMTNMSSGGRSVSSSCSGSVATHP